MIIFFFKQQHLQKTLWQQPQHLIKLYKQHEKYDKNANP
tara:strand:- start:277 stop:393 length:117 start_codon:yes stop_codon:yes gene_type:complete